MNSTKMSLLNVHHWRHSKWRWVCLVALVVAVGLSGVQKWRGPKVPAVQVTEQTLVRTLQFSARVETNSRVGVGSTVVGRVQEVAVREADRVRAGQLLIQLESTELQAAQQQAQAAWELAQAQISNISSHTRASSVAQVAQAQAALTQAQIDWERQQTLIEEGFYTQAALDEKRKALDVAQAQLEVAQAQAAAVAENGAQLRTAQAQEQQALAALEVAKAKLAQTKIVAPSNGKVLQRDVEPGQIVQPGTVLLQLALEGPTLIVAQVDERFLDQLREGQAAYVVADAFPEQRLPAKIVSIAPNVDAQRGAVKVKLALDAPAPPFLREDMTVSVSVETGRKEHALVVPLDALHSAREGSAQAQILVLRNGVAAATPVRIGMRTLEAAQITQGLQAGEWVLLPPAKIGERVRAQSTPLTEVR